MIRLKSRKNLLDNLSGVAKSTVWYILKKNECNCKLNNHNSPKTTVHADRVISMVKKTKSNEVKNSPDLSSSKFKIFVQRLCSKEQTTGYTQEQEGQITLHHKTSKRTSGVLEKKKIGQM